jgi:hypothetical protein
MTSGGAGLQVFCGSGRKHGRYLFQESAGGAGERDLMLMQNSQ